MSLCAFGWLNFDKEGSLASLLGEFVLGGLIFKIHKQSVLNLERCVNEQ